MGQEKPSDPRSPANSRLGIAPGNIESEPFQKSDGRPRSEEVPIQLRTGMGLATPGHNRHLVQGVMEVSWHLPPTPELTCPGRRHPRPRHQAKVYRAQFHPLRRLGHRLAQDDPVAPASPQIGAAQDFPCRTSIRGMERIRDRQASNRWILEDRQPLPGIQPRPGGPEDHPATGVTGQRIRDRQSVGDQCFRITPIGREEHIERRPLADLGHKGSGGTQDRLGRLTGMHRGKQTVQLRHHKGEIRGRRHPKRSTRGGRRLGRPEASHRPGDEPRDPETPDGCPHEPSFCHPRLHLGQSIPSVQGHPFG